MAGGTQLPAPTGERPPRVRSKQIERPHSLNERGFSIFLDSRVPRGENLAILGTKHKDGFEPYWQDEKDWLCIVKFLPTDNPEARLFAADIIGYLVGYANLSVNSPTN
jgi:hypothetical protein